MARWGMPLWSKALLDATNARAQKLEAKRQPVDFDQLVSTEKDKYTTNIRNVTSKRWTRWLGVENRCVVPFTSFLECNKAGGGYIQFDRSPVELHTSNEITALYRAANLCDLNNRVGGRHPSMHVVGHYADVAIGTPVETSRKTLLGAACHPGYRDAAAVVEVNGAVT